MLLVAAGAVAATTVVLVAVAPPAAQAAVRGGRALQGRRAARRRDREEAPRQEALRARLERREERPIYPPRPAIHAPFTGTAYDAAYRVVPDGALARR